MRAGRLASAKDFKTWDAVAVIIVRTTLWVSYGTTTTAEFVGMYEAGESEALPDGESDASSGAASEAVPDEKQRRRLAGVSNTSAHPTHHSFTK